MKVEYLISKKYKNGTFVKNLLFIDYFSQTLTTAERKYKKHKSDIGIKNPISVPTIEDKTKTINDIVKFENKKVLITPFGIYFLELKDKKTCKDGNIPDEVKERILKYFEKNKLHKSVSNPIDFENLSEIFGEPDIIYSDINFPGYFIDLNANVNNPNFPITNPSMINGLNDLNQAINNLNSPNDSSENSNKPNDLNNSNNPNDINSLNTSDNSNTNDLNNTEGSNSPNNLGNSNIPSNSGSSNNSDNSDNSNSSNNTNNSNNPNSSNSPNNSNATDNLDNSNTNENSGHTETTVYIYEDNNSSNSINQNNINTSNTDETSDNTDDSNTDENTDENTNENSTENTDVNTSNNNSLDDTDNTDDIPEEGLDLSDSRCKELLENTKLDGSDNIKGFKLCAISNDIGPENIKCPYITYLYKEKGQCPIKDIRAGWFGPYKTKTGGYYFYHYFVDEWSNEYGEYMCGYEIYDVTRCMPSDYGGEIKYDENSSNCDCIM